MFDRLMWALVVLAILGILAAFASLVAIAVDSIAATPVDMAAVVVRASHEGSRTDTSVGYVYGQNGGPVVQTHYTPEQWEVVVKSASGVFSADAEPERWADLEPGDSVTVRRWRGRVFGGWVRAKIR